MKTQVMTFEEFFRIRPMIEAEKKAAKIRRNKRVERFVVTSLGISFFLVKRVLANPFSPIGMKFWGYVKGFSYFACLILCGLEILKSLNGGDTKSISKIIFKYVLAYASFSLLPWLFREIDSAFSIMK
jgi:hypothetical protein